MFWFIITSVFRFSLFSAKQNAPLTNTATTLGMLWSQIFFSGGTGRDLNKAKSVEEWKLNNYFSELLKCISK